MGVTFFWVKNSQTLAALWTGAILCNNKKSQQQHAAGRNRALQMVIKYSFTEFCIYCFSLCYEFFVHYTLESQKNYHRVLDVGTLEYQLL
jgi:hypothetical protein